MILTADMARMVWIVVLVVPCHRARSVIVGPPVCSAVGNMANVMTYRFNMSSMNCYVTELAAGTVISMCTDAVGKVFEWCAFMACPAVVVSIALMGMKSMY